MKNTVVKSQSILSYNKPLGTVEGWELQQNDQGTRSPIAGNISPSSIKKTQRYRERYRERKERENTFPPFFLLSCVVINKLPIISTITNKPTEIFSNSSYYTLLLLLYVFSLLSLLIFEKHVTYTNNPHAAPF